METAFRESFIKKLSELGESIPKFAARAGVSKDMLHALHQRKTKNPNVLDAYRIAVAFGCSVEDMLGISGRKKKSMKTPI